MMKRAPTNMADSSKDSTSCSSSSSQSTNSSLSYDEEELVDNETQDFQGIQPWRFEPPGISDNQDSSDDEEASQGNYRLHNFDWCSCDQCQIMDREEECRCCQEIDQVKAKNAEAVEIENIDQPKCITDHPGFKAVCLNVWVLQTAWYQFRQQYGERAYEGPDHKQKRHIAYRQLVRWCRGVLGKNIRVPLPSCAVCCIRAHFPPPGLEDDYVFEGFRYFDD